MTYGITIDNKRNLYLTSLDGIRKFTESGHMKWEYKCDTAASAFIYDTASLGNGKVYGQDLLGNAFALDMETGKPIWTNKVSSAKGQNNGFTNVDVADDVVVVDSHAHNDGSGSHAVSGLNATSGSVLWTYTPMSPVWNFGASFPGDGSVVFQDRTGVAYRLQVNDGKELWKSAKHDVYSFTDGTATIDDEGNVYTVENVAETFNENTLGKLTKRRLADGQILWQVITPHPPNNQPVIGHGLVIQPMGSQQQQGAYTHVFAYDQKTGKKQWVFDGPAQKGPLQAGDAEFSLTRQVAGLPTLCWPNPWSSPGFGKDGTVYVGEQEGGLYSLRDTNGDGVVSGPDEVSVYQTHAAFPGSSSPAIAPGLLAIVSCDTLFVFKQ